MKSYYMWIREELMLALLETNIETGILGSTGRYGIETAVGLCTMFPGNLAVISLRCTEQLIEYMRTVRAYILQALDSLGILPTHHVEPAAAFQPELVRLLPLQYIHIYSLADGL